MHYIEIHTDRGCFHAPYCSTNDVIAGFAESARPFVKPPISSFASTKPSLDQVVRVLRESRGPYMTFRLTGKDLRKANRTISLAEKGKPVDGKLLCDLYWFLECVVLQDSRRFEGLNSDDIDANAAKFGVEQLGEWFGFYLTGENSITTSGQSQHLAWYFRKVLEIARITDLPNMDPVALIEQFLDIPQDHEGPRTLLDELAEKIFGQRAWS